MSKKTIEDCKKYFLKLSKSYSDSSRDFKDQHHGIKYYYDGAADAYKDAANYIEANFKTVLNGRSSSPKTRKPATRKSMRK